MSLHQAQTVLNSHTIQRQPYVVISSQSEVLGSTTIDELVLIALGSFLLTFAHIFSLVAESDDGIRSRNDDQESCMYIANFKDYAGGKAIVFEIINIHTKI